jgi:hypothetical protein
MVGVPDQRPGDGAELDPATGAIERARLVELVD